MKELPVAIKEASELAQKAQHLADRLKDITVDSANITSGVDPLVFATSTFILSCFIGYYVISKVSRSLHTPLMSITNAISSVVIVGAIVVAGQEEFGLSSLCGYMAIFIAAINICGGFMLTERMIKIFKNNSD